MKDWRIHTRKKEMEPHSISPSKIYLYHWYTDDRKPHAVLNHARISWQTLTHIIFLSGVIFEKYLCHRQTSTDNREHIKMLQTCPGSTWGTRRIAWRPSNCICQDIHFHWNSRQSYDFDPSDFLSSGDGHRTVSWMRINAPQASGKSVHDFRSIPRMVRCGQRIPGKMGHTTPYSHGFC